MANPEADKLSDEGMRLINEGRWAEALEVLDRSLALDPDKSNAIERRQQAQAGLKRGGVERMRAAVLRLDYAEAARLGEKVLDITREPAVLDLMRRPLFDRDPLADPRPTLLALDALLAAAPQSPWGLLYRAQLGRLVPERAEECADDWRRLRQTSPDRYGWMRIDVARERLAARDFSGALEDLGAVLACDPENWEARCLTAEAHLCLGDAPAAFAACDEALRRATGPEATSGVTVWKGELLLWTGRFEESLRTIEQAGDHPYAACWRGGALLLLGRLPEAMRELDRVVTDRPLDVEARVWRAEALWRSGRPREALAETEGILKDGGGENLYARIVRGLAMDSLGEREGAAAELTRIASALHESIEDADALKRILERSAGVRRPGYETSVWMRQAS